MFSLVDTMIEMNAEVALVTETWLGQQAEQQITDMREALGYGCVRRDRLTRGGGVAIIYKRGDLELQQLKTGSSNEIVAAIGRRTGQRRKILIMAAYIPPNFNAEQSDQVMQEIANLIGTYKRRYNSPYVLLGGDFNKRNIQRELAVYTDMSLVKTLPTRGDNTLDLM